MKKTLILLLVLVAMGYSHSDFSVQMEINYHKRKANELQDENNELIRKIKSETRATKEIQNKIKHMGNKKTTKISNVERENITKEYHERQEAKRDLKLQMSR
jgi:septal ring factor EnvC (AmiA/AmiB activator)